MLKKFNFYELVGLIIGDGHIIYDIPKRRYTLELTGNVDEMDYFEKVREFLRTKVDREAIIKIRKEKKGQSLRLYLNNKKYVEFLIFEIELVKGNKTFKSKIPRALLSWMFMKHIIRGLFESDGSLYFSKGKRKLPYYPRIEIKSSSKNIIFALLTSLRNQNFRVNCRKCGDKGTFGVYLSGVEMLEKWNQEIGFSSYRNYSKYLLWKKLSFYIPKTSFEERKRLLAEAGWVKSL